MPTRIEALVVRVKVEDVPQRRGLKQAPEVKCLIFGLEIRKKTPKGYTTSKTFGKNQVSRELFRKNSVYRMWI